MSVADGTSVIPPGWYPDPADNARLRRWDGQQWTQEVLLAPEQAPADASVPTSAVPTSAVPTSAVPTSSVPTSAVPTTPPAAPESYSPPAVDPVLDPTVEAESPPPPPPPSPSTAGQPPAGQPVPASPAPSSAPPGDVQPTPPAEPQAPMAPTLPRPSPAINQHSNPSSGPVSLPEWANLPGLTLPPDLSSLPGMESDSALLTPTFAEPEPQRGLPTLPAFEAPYIPQRPDVQDVGEKPSPPTRQPSDAPPAPAAPAPPYAPPPAGAQYDVPPPPGMAHVPSSGPVLPPSAFVAPQMPAAAWPALPPVGSVPIASAPAAPTDLVALPRTLPDRSFEPAQGSATVSSWLIAILPLLQFAVVYAVFGVLAVTLAPGLQGGILAAPAALSLLFANADIKKLRSLGSPAPSIVFAFIPPLYLLVRCFTTGRSSVLPLVAWIVLQAGAVAGVYYLLPSLLADAISSFN